MPWFETVYRPSWIPIKNIDEEWIGKYGTHLWAKNAADAREVCQLRGMGERLRWPGGLGRKYQPYVFASSMMRSKRFTYKARQHALIYLSMVAMASGLVSPQDLLGDEGLLHEFAHGDFKSVKRKLEWLEFEVPGYRPPKNALASSKSASRRGKSRRPLRKTRRTKRL